MHTSSDLPTLARFARHLASDFHLAAHPGLALRLTEAAALDPARPDDHHFSLLFRGPAQPLLPQAIHTLGHADLGSLAIFLVPLGRDAGGTLYQAIFN